MAAKKKAIKAKSRVRKSAGSRTRAKAREKARARSQGEFVVSGRRRNQDPTVNEVGGDPLPIDTNSDT